MNNAQEKWKEYTEGVPGLDVAISGLKQKTKDDDSNDFTCFAASLPTEVSESLGLSADADKLDLEKQLEHHWCLCDMPEGDFPRVHVFSSLARLIAAISKREGSETAVWVTYGIPLRLTKPLKSSKGQLRYLLLPQNLAAVIGGKDSGKIINQSLLPDDLAIQEEGWLGDPEYLEDQNYFLDSNAALSDDSISGDIDSDSGYD